MRRGIGQRVIRKVKVRSTIFFISRGALSKWNIPRGSDEEIGKEKQRGKGEVEKSSLIPPWPPKRIVSHSLPLAKSRKQNWYQAKTQPLLQGIETAFNFKRGKNEKRYKSMKKENRKKRQY